MNNDLFDAMVKEAMEEVGNHGWREASQNAVTLAAFGLMCQKFEAKLKHITRPAWIIALSIVGSALWYIISGVVGL